MERHEQLKSYQSFHYFRNGGHNFIQHAKFTLIELLTQMESISRATLKRRLKLRDDFWIIKLDTLSPKGLNQELDKV